MKIRNQNSSNTWQSQVRAHDMLAGRQAYKEEIWKKLRARLDNTPKKKSRAWYWIAAASVVLLLLTKFIFVQHKEQGISPVSTNPKTLIKNNMATVPNDATQVNIHHTAKASGSRKNKPADISNNSLEPLHAKQQKIMPVPDSSMINTVYDTQLVKQDIETEPVKLPTVHINDLISKEPLPENITTRSLGVKKLIRLFNVDMTGGQPPKNLEKIPGNQITNLNNQN